MAPFVGGMIALAVGSAINLILPELVRRILDPQRFSWVLTNLVTVIISLAALFMVQGLAFFLRSYLLGLFGQRIYATLRERLFSAVLAKDASFFDASRASDLAARINSDAALVQDAVSVKLSIIIRYGLQVALGVVLMLFMSWKLTLAIVISVLVLVVGSLLFVSKLRGAGRLYQDALARFTSLASESFGGIKIVRVLGAREELIRRGALLNSKALTFGERRILWGAGFSSGASALLNILLLCVTWYGVSLVLYGALPLNELAAFVLYGAIVGVSFSFLISAYSDLQQSLGGLERVVELIDPQPVALLKDAHEGPVRSSRVDSLGVELVFNRVTFAYPERSDTQALIDLCFVVTSGSCTAFVGPSGSGKSSLVQLICRLYQPQAGEILVNGTPLNELSELALYKLIAWVPQESTLFGFTVLENLLLGNQEQSSEEAFKILSGWKFLDFVQTLEDGFDTKLGENGTLISGGQRQRLAIARALLRRPKLLILDEATSGLDSDTEAQVMKTVRSYLPQATVIVISHRLATVKDAEKIYVLDSGAILEQGTHKELTSGTGLYRQYVDRQRLE